MSDFNPIANPVEENGLPSNLAPASKLGEKDRILTFLPGGTPAPSEGLVNATQLLTVRDDIVQEFGEDVYDQMYRDPALHAAIQALRITVTANGTKAMSSAKSVADPDFERRANEAQSASRMLEGLSQDIYDLTLAVMYRHALSEISYELYDDPFLKKPIWNFRRLKLKNRRNYYLVCDYDLDLIGVVNSQSMKGFGSNTDTIPPDSLVPAEKLVLFVPFALESDPRGHSLARSAYNAWRIKSNTWASYYRYLNKFAVPDIVITAGEKSPLVLPKINYVTGVIETDANGSQVEETREMANYRAGLNLSVGGANVLSLPPGTTAQLLFAQGSGEAFTKAFEALDRQIVMSILLSPRTLLEAAHSSKADSETSADTFDILVTFVRKMLEETLQTQVIDRWYVINIGDDVENAPRVSLSDDSGRNLSKIGPIIAQLLREKFFHTSQYEGLDQMLGAPPRDYQAWGADLEEEKEAAANAAAETQKLLNPMASGMDDSEDPATDLAPGATPKKSAPVVKPKAKG